MRLKVLAKGMHMIEYGVQYEKDHIMVKLLADKCSAYGWTPEYARKAVDSTMKWYKEKLREWSLASKKT
jgi:queuine/archaeosine tRNA-ribosyltransferase